MPFILINTGNNTSVSSRRSSVLLSLSLPEQFFSLVSSIDIFLLSKPLLPLPRQSRGDTSSDRSGSSWCPLLPSFSSLIPTVFSISEIFPFEHLFSRLTEHRGPLVSTTLSVRTAKKKLFPLLINHIARILTYTVSKVSGHSLTLKC